MNLLVELERARAEEARLAEERKAAWERDPGNNGIIHTFLNAHGYHTAFLAWQAAHDRVRRLEKQIAKERAA